MIAQLIEHLAHPEVIVEAALKNSHSQTLFFITTVVNLEAVDRIFLFRKLEEVREFCERTCRLKIVDELDLPLKLNLKDIKDEAFEVALVCRPA